ncbi:MAG TPA: aminotransferase class III-fold pyridoxal phosphate-dependent enzyme, partial [Bacillota bacterium]
VIQEVRGRGLMIGVQLAAGAAEVARRCREQGLLVNAIGDRVIRLLPPLVVRDGELDAGLEILTGAIASL